MLTLERFAQPIAEIPAHIAWYLSEIGEARGRQDLFVKQSPQTLKVLREHALVESAVSSNRLEGVEADSARVATVVFGKSAARDRDEEEIRGYRRALERIHARGARLPLDEKTVRELHRLTRGEIWDAGKYKERDGDIIEKHPDGRERVRFKTVPAADTPRAMRELIAAWPVALRERAVHPLIALAAFDLDFLCIHPFRDGNGRVSRLLWLLQLYQLGYEVGRYVSLERIVEASKERYYETLEQSSTGWHQGKHDPWPFVGFVLVTIRDAYREFEQRAQHAKEPRGAKTTLVLDAIAHADETFTLRDLERACPLVSRDHLRHVLKQLREQGAIESLGRGPGARWRKKGR